MNNRNNRLLWFFSDYNDTYDIIENDTNKIERLFSLLDDIRVSKNLDKIAFSFVSLNNCEFLRDILSNLNNMINDPSTNIPNKDKIVLFSVLGDNGYMISPCSKKSHIISSKHNESKAEQMYKILLNSKVPGEFIYADDCPIFNLTILSNYFSVNPIPGINGCTFIGTSKNDVISEYPNDFEIILDKSDEFLINGLEKYTQILHDKYMER